MKKFRYRLEALLRIKQHRERERQKEHAEAVQLIYDQRSRLNMIDSTRSDTLDRQRTRQQGSLSLAFLQQCSRYLVKLKRDTILGRETLRAYESEAEKRRRRLVKASQERQIFEKLRDKQKDRYYKEIDQRENRDNDEIALVSFRLNQHS